MLSTPFSGFEVDWRDTYHDPTVPFNSLFGILLNLAILILLRSIGTFNSLFGIPSYNVSAATVTLLNLSTPFSGF